MALFVLIRPGCTEFDQEHRIQGEIELPLSAAGVHQVNETLMELRGVPLNVVYTSPNDPAKSTAAMVAWEFGIPLKELPGLQNVNQGLWQGLQIEELRRKIPTVFRQWQDLGEAVCPPEGELLSDAFQRVKEAIAKPMKKGVNVAFVACEPIATLIRLAVLSMPLQGENPVCDPGSKPMWEFLQTNGFAPERTESLRLGNGTILTDPALSKPASTSYADPMFTIRRNGTASRDMIHAAIRNGVPPTPSGN